MTTQFVARPIQSSSRGFAFVPSARVLFLEVLFLGTLFWGAGFLGAGSGECRATEPAVAAAPGLRASDVVFMYDDPKMYQEYGCTVLGWAGSHDKDHIARAHKQGVRLFTVSVGFLTEFQGMIDFSSDFQDAAARNFAGEPFIVPWLWDQKHKGEPAWWWCTNSPLYRQFLESRLRERMPAEPDGLHIDDYRGASASVGWLSGCFCRHCLAGFRRYLAEHVDKAKLEELGIKDLETFDYRQFLIDRGVTVEKYKQESWGVPLADEFLDFHVTANTQYVSEYRKLAEQIRGRPLTLSVNSGLDNAQALAIASQLTYFCCEVPHHAEKLAPATEPIYIYKLGEGLRRPIASTAAGQDWAFVAEHNKPCLVRSWVALSYALGNNLMAPHRQWCYTEKKGTHWYEGPAKEYAYVYRFVREQAALLDDYRSLDSVAVVYDNAANRRYQGSIRQICEELAQRNIPFHVVVAGDGWLGDRLSAEQLRACRAVITTPDEQWLDADQKSVLAEVRAADRLVVWPNDERLTQLVPRPITVVGSDKVMALPRAKPGDANAPLVLHLLNRDYDGATDTLRTQEGLKVQVRLDLLPDRAWSTAKLHVPGAPTQALTVRTAGDQFEIDIPALSFWGIVELN